MTRDELIKLALQGLQHERQQLQARIAEIGQQEASLQGDRRQTVSQRKPYTMTAAAKKAVSARMKKYWARRRRESKQK